MIKLYFLLSCFALPLIINAQQQWTWMGGDKSPNTAGTYGTIGVASSQNFPGSRIGASTWTDKEGNMWMFGGTGKDANGRTGYLNDLWKFNPSSKQWIWIGGSKTINAAGAYGKMNAAAPTNQPGARQNATFWTDSKGNFWLFGGLGIAAAKEKEDPEKPDDGKPEKPGEGNGGKDDNDKAKEERERKEKEEKEKKEREEKEKKDKEKRDKKDDDDDDDDEHDEDDDDGGDDSILDEQADAEGGLLNDLWMYSPSTEEWTWIIGHTKADRKRENNIPGGRFMSGGWIDAANNLWIFGGRGYASTGDVSRMNDVWKFSTSSLVWTLMKDESRGDDAPSPRTGSTTWLDKNGNFWLFGGNTESQHFGDLWMYDPKNNAWKWMTGSKNGSGNADPGARTLAAGWIDNQNDLWVFGGKGYGTPSESKPLNNFWKYSLTTNKWTFVKGEPSNNPVAVYGTRGIASDNSTPGGTANTAMWKSRDGSVWIFGGQSSNGYSNLLWKLSICTESVTGMLEPKSATICQGATQMLTASGGSSYSWMRDGQKLNGQNSPTLTVNLPGTYTAVITGGGCGGPVTLTATVAFSDTSSGIRYPDIKASANVPVQLTARNSGTAYQWTPATVLDNANSDAPNATLPTSQQFLVYITGDNSCITTDTLLVKIENKDIKKISVPTAFTPNGNGSNDVLRPLGQLSSLDYFRVYNRWGKMLYQTSIPGEGWDGRFSGTIQPSETYTWILSGKSADGQQVKLSGKTVLIR